MKQDHRASLKPPPRNFSNGLSLIVTERGGETGVVLQEEYCNADSIT